MEACEPKPCNWCGILFPPRYVEGSERLHCYCLHCERHCQRECLSCHKPYPSVSAFFPTSDSFRCNSCQKKYLRQISLANIKRKIKSCSQPTPPPFFNHHGEPQEEPNRDHKRRGVGGAARRKLSSSSFSSSSRSSRQEIQGSAARKTSGTKGPKSSKKRAAGANAKCHESSGKKSRGENVP